MADPLEETISLSDMTEITETEDPRATQQSLRAHATGSLVRGCPDGGEPGRRVRQDKDSHVTSNKYLAGYPT